MTLTTIEHVGSLTWEYVILLQYRSCFCNSCLVGLVDMIVE